MAAASWLHQRSNNTIAAVKIVYPGGRVEFYDRPIVASEIIQRNPKFCVARSDIFQQPWSVVPADAVLLLGEKFYVVPITTVKKLRKISIRNSPNAVSSAPSHYRQCKSTTASPVVIGEERWKNRGCFGSLIFRGKKKKEKMRDCFEFEQMHFSKRKGGGGGAAAAGNVSGGSRRRGRKSASSSPSRQAYYSWQPSLKSISEEN